MADSFNPAVGKTPTTVNHVQIIFDVFEGTPRVYNALYSFSIYDQAGGALEHRSGNLIPHLTTAQKTQAQAFLDSMLDKAKGTV